jgi:hypothetical protein
VEQRSEVYAGRVERAIHYLMRTKVDLNMTTSAKVGYDWSLLANNCMLEVLATPRRAL